MPKKVAVSIAHAGAVGPMLELRSSSLLIIRSHDRSAAVLGGCRAGIVPAHPDPGPILQVRLFGISRHVTDCVFEFSLVADQMVIILSLPQCAVSGQDSIRCICSIGLP